jgi:hypothetical protein
MAAPGQEVEKKQEEDKITFLSWLMILTARGCPDGAQVQVSTIIQKMAEDTDKNMVVETLISLKSGRAAMTQSMMCFR